jgi:chloramphenicol 3-O-phosphotransferase
VGSIVMLSGPVGAGKTTVAKELVALWEGPLTYIEGDRFWPFLARRKEGDRREDFRVLMRSMTAAALPFARSGYDVLLDFSFPPAFLKTARAIIKEVPLDFVLLHPSLEVCASRSLNRDEGRIVDYERYRDFYALFAGADRHTIADDAADAKSLAARVQAGLRAGSSGWTLQSE